MNTSLGWAKPACLGEAFDVGAFVPLDAGPQLVALGLGVA